MSKLLPKIIELLAHHQYVWNTPTGRPPWDLSIVRTRAGALQRNAGAWSWHLASELEGCGSVLNVGSCYPASLFLGLNPAQTTLSFEHRSWSLDPEPLQPTRLYEAYKKAVQKAGVAPPSVLKVLQGVPGHPLSVDGERATGPQISKLVTVFRMAQRGPWPASMEVYFDARY